jgi:mRNA (guanine-N7-)-methyltransferase
LVLIVSSFIFSIDNSRPDVGVVQRMGSPIIGLKAFNNWVKSVLITRFAHPTLQKSTLSMQGNRRGKILDMGCGKGGDISKWSKSRAAEVFFIGKSHHRYFSALSTESFFSKDIASMSVEQAKTRWEAMKGSRFDASFGAIDCFTESIRKVFPANKLSVPFDVVSMQFCMHYAFETAQKVRCMLDNVTTCLRTGGIFIGTIPNSEVLL